MTLSVRSVFTFLLLLFATISARSAVADVEPHLAAHMQRMAAPELVQVGERVHWAMFYDYSNFGFIEGETSIIAVDCGWWPGAVKKAVQALRKRTQKPIRYIIYTHGHGDHLGGCSGIADQDQVEVIANEEYERYRDEMVSSRLPFISRRATDQMGFLLPRGPKGSVGAGVGPGFYNGAAAYYPPTRLVAPDARFELDGVRIELIPTPVDIDDAVSVFLPEEGILFPGDAIIGTGPVIATPRQEKGRDPYLWMNSLDVIADLPFQALLPGHGPVYTEREKGLLAVRRARDTIQFIIDHVVRGLNDKIPRDDIISSLALPPELANDPNLGWHYHSLQWVARGVYTNFAGWYTDDIRDLFEIDPDDEALLLVEALGGPQAALNVAKNALDKGERSFAGRLLSQVLRAAPDNTDVLEAMVTTLEAGAYAADSTSQRNYMLMEASVLKERYDRSSARPFVDVVSLLGSVPTDRLLANITPRLQASIDPELEKRLTLFVSDRDEYYTLNIRRGVLRVVAGIEKSKAQYAPATAQVDVTSDDLVLYVLRALTVREALNQERFVTDDIETVTDFFSHIND